MGYSLVGGISKLHCSKTMWMGHLVETMIENIFHDNLCDRSREKRFLLIKAREQIYLSKDRVWEKSTVKKKRGGIGCGGAHLSLQPWELRWEEGVFGAILDYSSRI